MLGNSTKRLIFKDIQNYYQACPDQRKSIRLFPSKKWAENSKLFVVKLTLTGAKRKASVPYLSCNFNEKLN